MRTVIWKSLSSAEKAAVLIRPALQQKPDLTAKVANIISLVRSEGDSALKAFSEKFDGVTLQGFEVSPEEFTAARQLVSETVREALQTAAANIESFHALQIPQAIACQVGQGIFCERRPRAIQKVGLYAPGGSACLPSTVLMLGIPSRLAGCAVRILCTPPRKDGSVDPYVLEAAALCGINRVFKLGGAHAIAAMAFGTHSIPKVEKIFGPGNSWVTEAKAQVAQDPRGAACDLPAGPSEVLVIADERATPQFTAADLLSQAEHGADSQVLLVTCSQALAAAVEDELQTQVETLPRAEIAKAALKNSLFIVVETIEEAIAVSNEYAPEHLLLQVEDSRSLIDKIQNAGSVFIGRWSPESAGDYATGTNHVLPTYGHARAVSGLSMESFYKQITFQELSAVGLQSLGPAIETLAAIEGLEAHRRAVLVRRQAMERGER